MSDRAFRVGDICDKYEVVELIAVGGSGEVYRAVQRSIEREVALKCLQFRHVEHDDLQARMRMESRALARINHPNVVTVFDAGCTDRGVLWIAMELLKGQTLREILYERWRLPIRQAVATAIDVADGVAAAHEQSIIHRDLKPENVFITTRGIVKVLDLGTAKLHGWGELKTTDRGQVIGTPAYMAPEHIRCTGVDEKTDVYAVGLLLYEMLAGHPFAHLAHLDDYTEVARLQLHAKPRPLTEVLREAPPNLSNVVLQALEKEPICRPTMSELVSALRDVAGLPQPAHVVTPRHPPSRRRDKAGFGPHGTVRIAEPVAPLVDAQSERLARPKAAPALRYSAVVGAVLGVVIAVVAIGVSKRPSVETSSSSVEPTAVVSASASARAEEPHRRSSPAASSVACPASPPAKETSRAGPVFPPSTVPKSAPAPPRPPEDLGDLRDLPPATGRKMPSSGL